MILVFVVVPLLDMINWENKKKKERREATMPCRNIYRALKKPTDVNIKPNIYKAFETRIDVNIKLLILTFSPPQSSIQ